MPPPPLPVHRLITIEDLRPYSPEELATRPILHPDYAEPFNPDFTWRAYIALSLEGQISEHVAQTLDQLSQTAEGQQLIRQAAAVNQLKPKQYGEAFPFLFITEAPASNQDRESHYDGSFGYLDIDPVQIATREYLTTDGQWHDFSVQRVVVHELFHAANPNINLPAERFDEPPAYQFLDENGYRMPHEGAGWFGLLQWQLDNTEAMRKRLIEDPVIGETNRFMEKYFGERSHRRDHHTWRVENAADAAKTTQPNLGADHFYDEIDVPDVPDARGGPRQR